MATPSTAERTRARRRIHLYDVVHQIEKEDHKTERNRKGEQRKERQKIKNERKKKKKKKKKRRKKKKKKKKKMARESDDAVSKTSR